MVLGRMACSGLLALVLAGCAVEWHRPAEPARALPDRAGALQPAPETREAMRALLGAPYLDGGDLGFDLFREEIDQVTVPVAITPLPVPFARLVDTVRRYTLVQYDAQGRITARASGLHRRAPDWRAATVEDNLVLRLDAGDLSFVAGRFDRRETLLASAAWRDAWLARAPAGCEVVAGCAARGCSDGLRVDDGPLLPAPARLPATEGDAAVDALVWLPLAPGAHRLQFVDSHFRGEQSLALTCAAGERTWLRVDAWIAPEDSSWPRGKPMHWALAPQAAMPPEFAGRPLLLWRDGRWLVSP